MRQCIQQRQAAVTDIATNRYSLRVKALGEGKPQSKRDVRVQLIRHPAADIVGLEARQDNSLGASVDVIESDDIVLTQVGAGLHFD